MRINAKGLALLKRFEGCRLTAYKDVGGILTIGWGHTGFDIKPNQVITQQEADRLLEHDLEGVEAGTWALLRVPIMLSSNQFSALVCFSYNCGLGALAGSTLMKKINECQFDDAALEFLKWNHVNGQPIAGLTRRRVAEKILFESKE